MKKSITILSMVLALAMSTLCLAQPKNFLAKGASKEALEMLERMYKAYDKDIAPAEEMFQQGRYRELEAFLRNMEGKHPLYDGDVIYRLVTMYLVQEQWANALREVERLDMTEPWTVYIRGVCLGMTGKYDQSCYDRAMDTLSRLDERRERAFFLPPPGRPENLIVVCAVAYSDSASPYKWIKYKFLRCALTVAPRDPMSNFNMSNLLWSDKHFLAAVDHLEITYQETTGEFHKSLGGSLYSRKLYAKNHKS